MLEGLNKPKTLGLLLGLPAVDGLHMEASGAHPWSASDCWLCRLRKAKASRALWWGLPGCPSSAGCCWLEHTQHFTANVHCYLHVCEECARPQHASCSPRGTIIVGAEQVEAHLPPEGRCSRGNLFQLELDHSACVTAHVKWDNQANTWPVFYLPVSRITSPMPYFIYKCSCLKIFPVLVLLIWVFPPLLEMVWFGDPWTRSDFQSGQHLQEADSCSPKTRMKTKVIS